MGAASGGPLVSPLQAASHLHGEGLLDFFLSNRNSRRALTCLVGNRKKDGGSRRGGGGGVGDTKEAEEDGGDRADAEVVVGFTEGIQDNGSEWRQRRLLGKPRQRVIDRQSPGCLRCTCVGHGHGVETNRASSSSTTSSKGC